MDMSGGSTGHHQKGAADNAGMLPKKHNGYFIFIFVGIISKSKC